MESNNSVWKFLDELKSKQGISEIAINHADKVFVEKGGKFIQLDAKFDRKEVYDFLKDVAKLNNKNISMQDPILDGSLPDGSRINAVIEPFCGDFPVITIRKYIKKDFSLDDDGVFGLDNFWNTFLKSLIHSRQNIIISGGTSVGKTTFLNTLINEIDSSERVITIEDTKELVVPHINSVRLEVIRGFKLSEKLVTMRDMVKNTLRMRPDRIIIGEVRGEEIFDLMQSMNVGHDGSMTSIHSNSTGECLNRMETLYLLAGYDVPYRVVRRHISTAVNFIIQLGRDKDGNRVVTEIAELTGLDGDTIQMHHIAKLENDMLTKTGRVPQNMKLIHKKTGLPLNYFQ